MTPADPQQAQEEARLRLPFMPWWYEDFISSPSVQGMTTEEIGAYMLLLGACWASGRCHVSAHVSVLSQVTRLGARKWNRSADRLMACFVPAATPGYITNKKLQSVWDEAVAVREQKKEAGKKGAASRWHRYGDAIGNANSKGDGIGDDKGDGKGDGIHQRPKTKRIPTEYDTPPPPSEGVGESPGPLEESHAAHQAIVQAWNAVGSVKSRLTAARRKKITARLLDPYFRDNWQRAIEKVPDLPFLHGGGDRGWKADFDWFLQANSVEWILEGKYDGNGQGGGKGPKRFPGDTYDPNDTTSF